MTRASDMEVNQRSTRADYLLRQQFHTNDEFHLRVWLYEYIRVQTTYFLQQYKVECDNIDQ